MRAWIRENWIVAIVLAVTAVSLVVAAFAAWPVLAIAFDGRRVERSFFIPSESMLPTLGVGDRLMPRRLAADDLRRGQVVIFTSGADFRVYRIVAVGGDTIAISHGRPVLNGRPVDQRPLGRGPALSDAPVTRLLLEKLPGEAGRHRIIDAGESDGDERAMLQVPVGGLYVLGDNRDLSADSRFPPDMIGVGIVPTTSVVGIVDSLLWAQGGGDRGRLIDGDAR